MVLISGMFGQAQPVMLSFPYERPMFMREYSTGTCKYLLRAPVAARVIDCLSPPLSPISLDGVVPYFLSKIFLELPMTFMQSLITLLICYYMIGFQGEFMVLTAAMFGLGVCSCSVALCLGGLTFLLFSSLIWYSLCWSRTRLCRVEREGRD